MGQTRLDFEYREKDSRAFTGWLSGLNFIRNVSAHHSRLWNINVLERAPLLQDDENWKQMNNARPFFYFCLMQKLMHAICPNSRWSQRFAELLRAFPDVGCGSVSLADFGLIEGWEDWGLWEQK